MSATLRAYGSAGYWKHGFSLTKLATTLLTALGTLWLLTELLIFFELAPRVVVWLKANWELFAAAGFAWAVWENRPQHSVSCRLKNRDVRIEIRVGDLFAGESGVVISCNTSFDTDTSNGIISPKSVQGQFTSRYYTDVAHLDTDITRALNLPHVPTPTQQAKRGKPDVYPVGTTVTVRPRGRTAYLCAIAHMNPQGNAYATFDDVKTALPQLWDHISSGGDHGDIVVPVLGSGLSRVAENRETLIREILASFIAACAAQRPCASLAVVIHPADYYSHEMDLKELGDFLTHLCKYTSFSAAGAPGRGQPMPGGAAPTQAVPNLAP